MMLVQFVHDIISNLDGAVNRRHKQTDLIIMDFAKAFGKVPYRELELGWPSLEARRGQSSLLLFHKIYCGAVSNEKDKYMTPAHSLKSTRSSHSAQYRRHQTYSDALKNSFFP